MTGPILEELKAEIILLLQREVALMRELLSNMSEEERALKEWDPKSLQLVMLEREQPLLDLQKVRFEVAEKAKAIRQLSPKLPPLNFSDLLEAQGVDSCEVMILCDQIVALTNRMNAQQASVAHLMEIATPQWKDLMHGALTLGSHHPAAFKTEKPKQQSVMMTIEKPTT